MQQAKIIDDWTLHLLQQVARFGASQHVQTYLVGGALRDLLRGVPGHDWDLAISGFVPQFARRLADELGGFYVHMHERASRIIVKHAEREAIFDLAPLGGGSIEEDLFQRDFTVNAMAASLTEALPYLQTNALADLPLIDPLGGLQALQQGLLHPVNEAIFQQDPLRMLRAVRLQASQHFRLDADGARLLKRDAVLLSNAAFERIHDELYAILRPEGATRNLRFLDAHNLLLPLLPELAPARGMRQPRPHYWDVFEHSLETVGTLEQLVRALAHADEPIEAPASLLHQPASAGPLRELRALVRTAEAQQLLQLSDLKTPGMKLAALLHDVGKPATYTVDDAGSVHFYGHQQAGLPLAEHALRRLSVSTPDRRLTHLITAHHMRPGQLASEAPATPRALRRYFVDLGPQGLHVALFSLADHLATYGPAFATRTPGIWERHLTGVSYLLTRYLHERESILPPRLLSAAELIKRLRLEPGPQIGQLLEIIAEAQADGRVHSKEDALWLAQEQLLNPEP